jgi:hypothetical protein
MKLTWRTVAATGLIAGIVVPYTGYLTRGSMPFIHDVRAMATTALIIGVVACFTGDLSFMSVRWQAFTGVAAALGAVTLGLGIGAAVTGNSGLLACFIVAIVGMWALAMSRRAGLPTRSGRAHPTRTA